jgi:hypothetical protein
MEKVEIKEVLIKKIKERYLATTGKEPEINENTKPFEELDIFDSLLISEVGIELEDVIGYDFKDIKKVFEKADIEGLSIYEMAELISNSKTE